jgi:uncharacterized protein YkwD
VLAPPPVDATTVDGQYLDLGLRGAGVTTELRVAGRGGVGSDAAAVTLNVTSTGSVAAGFVTVYPCGTPRPNTSNLNFGPGMTVANAVTTGVGAGGAVCIYNSAPTHVIVDVGGYFSSAAGFGAIEPARLVDTRVAPPTGGTAAAESVALSLLNELRASRGLAVLASDATMTAFARNWSSTMSQSGFRHSAGPYAENIGWLGGASASPQEAARALHDGFVNSPPHFANMTDPKWTAVGVGVHLEGTTWFITFEFR